MQRISGGVASQFFNYPGYNQTTTLIAVDATGGTVTIPCEVVLCKEYTRVSIQILLSSPSSFSGVFTLYGSLNKINWDPYAGGQVTYTATSTAANPIFDITNTGIPYFYVNFVCTAGTANIGCLSNAKS